MKKYKYILFLSLLFVTSFIIINIGSSYSLFNLHVDGNVRNKIVTGDVETLYAANTLYSLKLSNCELSPKFSSSTNEYSCSVSESVTETSVEAVLDSNSSSISGDTNYELNPGENEINVFVTSKSGNINTYKITVTRNKPTVPTITGGSTTWNTASQTIKLSQSGTADSGVKHYEYYKTTLTVPPTDDTEATGTTSGNLVISDEGTTYVYYRTVSNYGLKSEWSDYQVTKIDTGTPTAPTITGGSTDWINGSRTISISTKSTSASDIKKYQYYISTSSTSQTGGSWTDMSGTSVVISTNGTRYIYVRAVNNANTTGTISGYQVTKIDTGTPTAPTITGGSTSWINGTRTISVSTKSTSVSDIKKYQYYISTSSTSQTGGSWTDMSGTSVVISTNGTRYIYVRAVNNANKAGTVSAYQVTKIDTGTPTAPTITGGSTSWTTGTRTISVSTKSTSASDIKKYQYYISTSSTSQTGGSWTDMSGTSVVISTNGTRYIYVRAVNNVNKAGTVSAYQVTKIDTTTPTITMNASIPSTITVGNSYALVSSYTTSNPSGTTLSCSDSYEGALSSTNTSVLKYAGSHTVTCTVKTGAGKTATGSKTFSSKCSSNCLMTNLVLNGSFEGDVGGWTNIDSATTSIIAYQVNSIYNVPKRFGDYTFRAQVTNAQVFARALSNAVSDLANHVVYVRVSALRESNTLNPGVYFVSSATHELWPATSKSTAVFYNTSNSSIAGYTWVDLSLYYTAPYNYMILMLAQSTASGNGVFHFDGLTVIDLTRTFGAGNEPTKAWCDSNITYFHGDTRKTK